MPPRPAPIIGRKPHAASSTANNRLSAVYIGTNPSITNSPLSSSHFTVVSSPPVDIAEETIPDLPEPPSPEGSFKSSYSGGSSSPERRRGTLGRNTSGLPSPPATNSTGSGSTRSKGDDREQNLEDFEGSKKGKERPVSLASSSGSSSTMSPSMNERGGVQDSPSMASSSTSPMLHTARRALHRNQSSISSVTSSLERSTRANDDGLLVNMKGPNNLIAENDDEGDNDETAKYDSIRRPPPNFTSEHVNDSSDALQRVRSLTQRNKMALDKLSSYPGPNSSSPRPPSASSRLSHTRSVKSTDSKGSHSRSQSHTQPRASTSRSIDDSDPHNVLSGSETERESVSNRSVSSHARSTIASASRRAEREREREREQHMRAPSRTRPRTPPTPPHKRTRVPSAPESPFTALTSANTHLNRAADRVGIGDGGRGSPGPPLSSHSSPSRRKRVSMATPPRMGYSVSSSAARDDDERGVSPSPYGEFGERTNMRAQSSLALVTPMADYEERRKLRESQREHRGSRDTRDIVQAALAAISSSRRGAPLDQASNTGSGASGGSGGRTRTRAALPFEFRNGGDSPRMTAEPEPMTPLRAPSMTYTNSNSSSNTTTSGTGSMATNVSGSSSAASYRSRPTSGISTFSNSLRHQQRHWSEDYGNGEHSTPPQSAGRSPRKDWHSTEYVRMAEYRERRQSLRGGSAESALSTGTYGRSLVGEGLRAAGLKKAQRLSLGATRTLPPLSFPSEREGEEHDEEREHEVRARRDTIVPSRLGGTPSSRAATSLGNYHHAVRERDQDEELIYERDLGDERRSARTGRASVTPSTRERSLARDEGMDRAASVLSRYGTLRTSTSNTHLLRERESGSASPYGARRQSNQPPTPGNSGSQAQYEHTRLLADSLVMFETHLTRLAGGGLDEAVRSAHTIVGLAERLNDLLRSNNARCLDEQVRAEVEDAATGADGRARGGQELAEVWGSLGAEFRDGTKLSDELIRTLTSFFLGIGRVVKDVGEPGGHHGRSVSLDEEGLRRRGSVVGLGNPDVFAGGSDGRRSRESRRSAEQPRDSVDAFIASRRISARAESALGQVRSVLRDGHRLSPPPPAPPSETSTRHSAGGSSGTGQAIRRLFTPRELRERDRETPHHPDDDHRPGMPTILSQEELQSYEPSPTPVSRTLNSSQATVRNQSLPSIPKPLPTLPSERYDRETDNYPNIPSRPTDTIRDSAKRKERRTASIIIPSRGPSTSSNGSHFPVSLTTPSNATTAITPHTVSNRHTPSPQVDKASFPSIRRGDSDNSSSGRSPAVTFSRPSTISVSALNGLQQKDGERRRRTESTGSNGAEPSTSYVPERLREAMSGSETERLRDSKLLRSRTLGPSRATARASLDGQVAAIRAATGTVNAADRSAAFSSGAATTRAPGTRERRRTVTDIWPQN